MKESPILFSKPMVLALLAGTKTQTRRAMVSRSPEMTALMINLNAGIRLEETKAELINCFSPYGHAGDLLWVREAWQPRGYWMEDSPEFLIHYPADNSQMYECFEDFAREEKYNDMMDRELSKKGIKLNEDGRWDGDGCPLQVRPGIHMWKEFSRIWLEVVDIRIERLLDISENDAIAEGVERWPSDIKNLGDKFLYRYQSYKTPVAVGSQASPYFAASQSFSELWETINEDLANTNPWVWVIEFKILSTTGRPADLEAVKQCTRN